MSKAGVIGRLALLLMLAVGPVQAQLASDADDSALLLADQAPKAQAQVRDWQFAVEAAAGETRQRYGLGNVQTPRLSLDVQVDTKIADGWRAVLSDQLDQRWQGRFDNTSTTNTLKEAYLSWQASPERALDVGRINARYGVAAGYNPTDYFRSGANRSITAIDPSSLKKNRQGSVMLRGQTLWNGGSLSAMVSPKLADQPTDASFSLDLGATNRQDRWLLALSQQLSDTVNPQWLLYGEGSQSPQLGFNLTGLLGQATVAYVEWSGGRSASQLAQALGSGDDTAFRTRLATGLTYTTDNKISITVEYDFNGAALKPDAWETLGRRAPQAYAQYRGWVQKAMDLPTQQSVFVYASWQDAFTSQLDINAMLRHNVDDHSQLSWLEARYHWGRTDVALQWQHNRGGLATEFGALQQEHVVQLLLRYFY
ncbi:MAG: hypothetical protein V4858_24660 [Pseudomonadota bacterium]